ncbi:ribosome small subunit-dependent GTPase A [Corynebacterium sp.]|uniref:ribosome small subunit-dependent GTPase A n=1 Tax=Corynebacterium sp. TaxID=1720 RepID=UPI0026DD35A1|nr:ribosome small subunit-dependent GTPase A [Corynebacterium sp.]MDO5077261.1 ribosome small subunit-dependent GTPase A [Corynebacterium sp.]
MARRSWDESDVRIRPGKGSRPRTKDRPAHHEAEVGMVVTKDRGRWGVILDGATEPIVCMRARELGRTAIVVGDRVAVVGDTSGRPGSLARIVRLEERTSVLRRTADDIDPYERIIVGNAQQLLIVSAIADPEPRSGFVERALIAAFTGGVRPIICLTKSDLGDPAEFAAEFRELDVPVVVCGITDPISRVEEFVDGHITALIGHSGVGKSTLVNRLVPDADRATGEVSGVGKGRHTSSQSVALRLPHGGWIIDTPGIRSFGLAHVEPDTIINMFDDLAVAVQECARGCDHLTDPDCGLNALTDTSARRATAVRGLLQALRSNEDWS